MKEFQRLLLEDLKARAIDVWGALCEIHPRLCRFDVPAIVLDNRSWRKAGTCHQQTRVVTISSKFYVAGYSGRMNHVILPHELIHQADFDLFGESDKKCGHGKNWQMLMVQYGLEPDKHHTMFINQQGQRTSK